jgi:hypothetical protein
MDRNAFYLVFIPLFTVLAFLSGTVIALMAISTNSNHPRDTDSEGGSGH